MKRPRASDDQASAASGSPTTTVPAPARPGAERGFQIRLQCLVFVSGTCLMAMEIAGARVLAPFFGSSIYVWGALIGIFMAAMSCGYFAGGHVSRAWSRFEALGAILALAAGWILVLPWWQNDLCRAIASDMGPKSGPVAASVALFALPSVLMGMASPFAVQLAASQLSRVGQTAGTLYAVSTLGSIAGTFLTAFYLIESFWIDTTLRLTGSVLLAACALLCLGGLKRLFGAGGAALAAFLVLSAPLPSALGLETPSLGIVGHTRAGVFVVERFLDREQRPLGAAQDDPDRHDDFRKAGVIEGDELVSLDDRAIASTQALQEALDTLTPGREYPLVLRRLGAQRTLSFLPRPVVQVREEFDSAYHRVIVLDSLWDGRRVRLLQFNRYIESGVFLEDYPDAQMGFSCTQYTDMFWLHRVFTPQARRVLVIGGGGGIVPQSIMRFNAREARDLTVDVVEIDPEVLRVSQKYFGYNPDDARIRHFTADGRRWLMAHPDERYDVIFLDAFTIGGRLPWHLMTVEFLDLVKAHLNAGGCVVANLNTAVWGEAGRIFASVYKTYGRVFAHRYVFPRHRGQHPRFDAPGNARADDYQAPPGWEETPRNVFLIAQDGGKPLSRAQVLERAEPCFHADWLFKKSFDAKAVAARGAWEAGRQPRELWDLWGHARALCEGLPRDQAARADTRSAEYLRARGTDLDGDGKSDDPASPLSWKTLIDADPSVSALYDGFAPTDAMSFDPPRKKR